MKTHLERRPLALAACGLVCGMVAVQQPVLLLLITFLVLWLRSSARVLFICLVLVGVLCAPADVKPILRRDFYTGRASVLSTPRTVNGSQSLTVHLADGRRLDAFIQCATELVPGDEMAIRGVLQPYAPDFAASRTSGGYSGAFTGDAEVVHRAAVPLQWAATTKSWSEQFLRSNLPHDNADLLMSSVFGSREIENTDLSEKLRLSGIFHLVSGTGLFVLLFAMAMHWVCSLLPIPRGIQVALVTSSLLFLVLQSAYAPSLVRVAILYFCFAAAYTFRRQPDWMSALALSVIVNVLMNPWVLYTPGFQIAAVVIGTLALLTPRKEQGFGGAALAACLRVFLATAAALPLVAYHFGSVSLLGVFATLLVLPVIPVLILFELAALGFALTLKAVAVGLLKTVVQPLSGYVLAVAHAFSTSDIGVLKVPPFSGWWLLLLYASAISGCAKIRANRIVGIFKS